MTSAAGCLVFQAAGASGKEDSLENLPVEAAAADVKNTAGRQGHITGGLILRKLLSL